MHKTARPLCPLLFHNVSLNGKKDRMKKGRSPGSGLEQVSVRGRGRIIIYSDIKKKNFCLLTFLKLIPLHLIFSHYFLSDYYLLMFGAVECGVKEEW